jgi:hypothetical protein
VVPWRVWGRSVRVFVLRMWARRERRGEVVECFVRMRVFSERCAASCGVGEGAFFGEAFRVSGARVGLGFCWWSRGLCRVGCRFQVGLAWVLGFLGVKGIGMGGLVSLERS